jgi:hypothetical protein
VTNPCNTRVTERTISICRKPHQPAPTTVQIRFTPLRDQQGYLLRQSALPVARPTPVALDMTRSGPSESQLPRGP